MRTKKQIEKMMIGMFLGGGCLLSSCHSVHMSAEDRLQGDYQEAAAEVELETVEELTAFAYNDVSVIPYTVENIARGFTDLSDEEIEELKKDFVAVEEQVSLFEKVDTEGVEPMVYPFEAPTTFLREDVVSDLLTQEEALTNVKDARMGHVHVPKVVK